MTLRCGLDMQMSSEWRSMDMGGDEYGYGEPITEYPPHTGPT